ncbi:MAG TPA: DUF3426 domain-containing protein [Geobacteraceae bacterium]
MIVQCDQCSTKFRLDDSKIKEGGAKVRCSKCKHIFVVQRETPAEETDLDSLLNGLVPPSPEASQGLDEGSPPGMELAAEPGEPSGSERPETVGEGTGGFAGKEEFDFDEFSFGDEPASSPAAAPFDAEEKGGLDFGELDLDRGDSAGPEAELAGKEPPAHDDNEFSFAEEPAPSAPEVEISIEGFGEPGVTEETLDSGTAPPPEEDFSAVPPMEFTFEPETAAVPMEAEPQPEKEPEQPDSFDFGEFEFGEASPAEKPAGGEPATKEPAAWEWEKQESPAHEHISAPPPYEQIAAPHVPEMPMADEELPPLSISSRRKGSSILSIAVTAISVALVLALAGGGFYFFKEGPAALNKVGLGFMAKWFGLEAKEEGGIAVRNPVGAFLNNKEAGELFVINGEAVNNFTKPRASVQVKALLYGAKGEVLLQKVAYCGNALSREQLTTLPIARLEAAMANQFGDSLSNLAVQPGKGIPFVIVFTNVPKETTDFGVEVAGSTVASQ